MPCHVDDSETVRRHCSWRYATVTEDRVELKYLYLASVIAADTEIIEGWRGSVGPINQARVPRDIK